MRTVTLEVAPLTDAIADFTQAWQAGRADATARISFATPELLWRVLTERRWALLRAMTGHGPMSLREAARRVQRDVKSVHRDVHALLDAGVLRRCDDGRVEFPYDAVHVDFLLRAA